MKVGTYVRTCDGYKGYVVGFSKVTDSLLVELPNNERDNTHGDIGLREITGDPFFTRKDGCGYWFYPKRALIVTFYDKSSISHILVTMYEDG